MDSKSPLQAVSVRGDGLRDAHLLGCPSPGQHDTASRPGSPGSPQYPTVRDGVGQAAAAMATTTPGSTCAAPGTAPPRTPPSAHWLRQRTNPEATAGPASQWEGCC